MIFMKTTSGISLLRHLNNCTSVSLKSCSSSKSLLARSSYGSSTSTFTRTIVSFIKGSDSSSNNTSSTPLVRLYTYAARSSTTTTSSSRCLFSSKVPTMFQAWRVEQSSSSDDDGSFVGSEQTLSISNDLPLPASSNDDDTVLIKVRYSSLNYKDALSASGNKGVTKKYPHTPGIDAAGQIVETTSSSTTNNNIKFNIGDNVLVTGYDLGMNTNGGFGEYIRVPSKWVVPTSSVNNIELYKAMIYGTAGLTAGLLVSKLLQMGATPSQGNVVVTGASGSVGCVAIELLSKLGFNVIGISNKDPTMLKELGAIDVLSRDTLSTLTKKPLHKPEYANAIDTVGGIPLSEILKKIKPGGSVACCGLVAGVQLETTVLPFILRGINLLGIDSVEIPLEEKMYIWKKLANEWSCPKIEGTAQSIGRHELDSYLKKFLQGKSSGKIVLDHNLTTKK